MSSCWSFKDLCLFLNTKIFAFLKIHNFLTIRVRGLKLGRSIDIMGDFGYTKFKGPGPLPWAPKSRVWLSETKIGISYLPIHKGT